jgi:hypothetical protein
MAILHEHAGSRRIEVGRANARRRIQRKSCRIGRQNRLPKLGVASSNLVSRSVLRESDDALLASSMAKLGGARVEPLPNGERAALLALARRIRAALPPGPSEVRELVVELERRLEVSVADEGAASG